MNEPADAVSTRVWRGRVTFLLVVSFFVVPFVTAWWLYERVESKEPWATSNKGKLITPAQPLTAFTLKRDQTDDYVLDNIRGKWTMVFAPPLDCTELCKKNIYHMRQVWVSLGREAPRVQRILVLRSESQYAELADFLKNYDGMDVVFDPDGQLTRQIEARDDYMESSVFLVDPLGNLMLAFPQALDPRDMLKDLKKVLKISTIG